jgi:hypothetical protein
LDLLDIVILALIDGSKENQIKDKDIVTSHTTIYLQKIMYGGVLILELGFDGIFAFVDLYVSDGKSNKKGNIKENTNRRLFLQNVTRLKDSLHMNSFLHDFHLRHFLTFLQNPSVEYPRFDIIDLLNNFHQYFESPPHYSKGLLIKNQLTFDVVDKNVSLKDIFNHICEFNSIFGVDNLYFRNLKNLIVFNDKIDVSNEEDMINCSVAFLGDNQVINIYTIHAAIESNLIPELNKFSIKERISTAQNISSIVEDKLKKVLNDASNHYKIQSLWNECQKFSISSENFEILLEKIKRDPLENFDASLENFVKSVDFPWIDILPQLKDIYGNENSGLIQYQNSETLHFLIKYKNSDEMINIEFHKNVNTVEIYYLRKDRTKSSLTFEDCKFISEFVNHVLQILWRILMVDAKNY